MLRAGITGFPAQQLSFEAWVKFDPNPGQYFNIAIFSSGAGSWYMYHSSTGVYFVVFDANATWRAAHVASAPYVNKWTHFCGTYDGRTVRIYADGVFQAATDIVDPAASLKTTGALNIGYSSGITQWHQVGQCRVWNTCLTAAQVAQRAAGSFEDDAALISRWRFNEPSTATSVVDDVSGNDLTFNNSPLWWGSWLQAAFFIISVAYASMWMTDRAPARRRLLGYIGAPFALAVGVLEVVRAAGPASGR